MKATAISLLILGTAVAVPDLAAKKAKIVSQSATGKLKAQATCPIPFIPFNETVEGSLAFHIDADAGNFRFEVELPQDNETYGSKKPVSDGLLLSGQSKRMYHYDGSCEYFELPQMTEPSKYVACFEGLLQKGKRWFKDEWTIEDTPQETKLGPFTLGAKAILGLHIEEDGGIRKIDMGGSVSVLAFPVLVGGGEWTSQKTTLGKPEAGIFEVPSSWGECQKDESDPFGDESKLSKNEKAWLQCLKEGTQSESDLVMV